MHFLPCATVALIQIYVTLCNLISMVTRCSTRIFALSLWCRAYSDFQALLLVIFVPCLLHRIFVQLYMVSMRVVVDTYMHHVARSEIDPCEVVTARDGIQDLGRETVWDTLYYTYKNGLYGSSCANQTYVWYHH